MDARAFAGGTPLGGGFDALGFGGLPTTGTSLGGLSTAGLSKQNQVQTTSFAVAPYLVHRFGDFGTGKLGYQLSQSSFSQGNSFLPLFFVTDNNASENLTQEAIGQFESGDQFYPFRNLVTADAQFQQQPRVNRNASQALFVDRLAYLVSDEITVFGELGYENIRYNGVPPTRISDAVWAVGTTLTPNADSRITMSFGHRYGEANFQLDGYYALTARTRIAAS